MDRVPSRAQQLDRLAGNSPEDPFDVLIIGGGASGAGCAVDAQTRWVPVEPFQPGGAMIAARAVQCMRCILCVL